VSAQRGILLGLLGAALGFVSLVAGPAGITIALAAGILFAVCRPRSVRVVEVGFLLLVGGATAAAILASVLVSAAQDRAVVAGPSTGLTFALVLLVALAGLVATLRARRDKR